MSPPEVVEFNDKLPVEDNEAMAVYGPCKNKVGAVNVPTSSALLGWLFDVDGAAASVGANARVLTSVSDQSERRRNTLTSLALQLPARQHNCVR